MIFIRAFLVPVLFGDFWSRRCHFSWTDQAACPFDYTHGDEHNRIGYACSSSRVNRTKVTVASLHHHSTRAVGQAMLCPTVAGTSPATGLPSGHISSRQTLPSVELHLCEGVTFSYSQNTRMRLKSHWVHSWD